MCKKLVDIKELCSPAKGKVISRVCCYLKFERNFASLLRRAS